MEELVFKGFKRDFSATFPCKPHHILSVYPLRRIYPCIAKGFSPKDSKIAHGWSSLRSDFYSFYQNNIPFQPQDSSFLIGKNSQIKPRKSEQV